MNKPTVDRHSILVRDQRARLIAHLVREHRWDEWDLTELHAVENLHAELHEQLQVSHEFNDQGRM